MSAHLRWFVDSAGSDEQGRYSMDVATILVSLGAALFAVLMYVVHRNSSRWGLPFFFKRFTDRPEKLEWRIIAVFAAVMLLDNVRTGVFLASNLVLPDPAMVVIGAVAQAVLALILITQLSFVVSGLLIVVALLLAALYFPAAMSLDYVFEFGCLAAALVFVGPRLSSVDRKIFSAFAFDPRRWDHLPLPLLRIGIGLTLVVLAIHNKLMSPALVLEFLSEHNFNFMPALGFTGFTDVHFAFAAGVAELTFGILLVAGIATRLVTLLVSVFFVLTLANLRILELTGHLPIIAIALLLVIRGSGRVRMGGALKARGSREIRTSPLPGLGR